MSKCTGLLGIVYFLLCFSSAWAWDDSNVAQTYVSALNPQDMATVHGYYPKQFSPEPQPNYWITPEEAGHYILGRSRNTYSFSKTADTPTPRVGTMADQTRVLVAPARVLSLQEIPAPEPPKPDFTNRPPRINDSSDLPETIKKHAWIVPFDL